LSEKGPTGGLFVNRSGCKMNKTYVFHDHKILSSYKVVLFVDTFLQFRLTEKK